MERMEAALGRTDIAGDNGSGDAQSVGSSLEHLLDGDWNRTGERGRDSYLAEAVGELYGVSTAEAAAKIKAKSEAEQKALAANPKVAAKIAAIKAKTAADRAAKAQERLDDADEEEMPEL